MDGKTADIEALEEEVERWKQAATDEAAAGAAVMEDLERCQFEVILLYILMQINFGWLIRRFLTWCDTVTYQLAIDSVSKSIY